MTCFSLGTFSLVCSFSLVQIVRTQQFRSHSHWHPIWCSCWHSIRIWIQWRTNKVTEQAHLHIAQNRRKSIVTLLCHIRLPVYPVFRLYMRNRVSCLGITSTNTAMFVAEEQMRFRTRMATPFSKIELPMRRSGGSSSIRMSCTYS